MKYSEHPNAKEFEDFLKKIKKRAKERIALGEPPPTVMVHPDNPLAGCSIGVVVLDLSDNETDPRQEGYDVSIC